MSLIDEALKKIDTGPDAKLDRLLDASKNQFEGTLAIEYYNDAIEAKGRCAHCDGPIEGVLHFPRGYRLTTDEMQRDARQQIIDRVRKEHYCIPRIDGPKLPREDFLKRFQ